MPDVLLTGQNFLGAKPSARGAERFGTTARQDGRALEPEFAVATSEEVDEAVQAAVRAFAEYGALPGERRAAFLEKIAEEIETLGDPLLQRAHAESGLPLPRLTGERARTCGQLRMFAALIREGSWVDARIDHAQPDRQPLPKPDIRRMLVPLGPVAVFGASNFPLAFSVAGGDTASALAAGCPVVVKAHPAHPGTSEWVARAVIEAAAACGMPDGVFSLLHGHAATGEELVRHPGIDAVGFTGSQAAGRALFNLAAARPRPIPVYAEMGSVNPLFLLSGALGERSATIAKSYAESLTMGVGQFCTNPGVVVGVSGPEFDAWIAEVGGHLSSVAEGTMLTDTICRRFQEGVEEWSGHAGLSLVHKGSGASSPALFRTTAKNFLRHCELQQELFGPAAIAVECDSEAELLDVAHELEGQLTASVHRASSDDAFVRQLLPLLTRMTGRVLFDGFPTGVEVCPSMQHGGPYPATTDSRSTSVGTAAILRFARPVAYQNMPDPLLPAELRESNPCAIWRLVDGSLTK